MRQLLPLLFLTLPLVPLTAAADDETGTWIEVSGQHDFSKKWSTEISLGHRLENNFTQPVRWDAGLSATYKPFKRFKLSAAYLFIRDYNTEEWKEHQNSKGVFNGYNVDGGFWRTKHRAYFEAAYKIPLIGHFNLTLRERYQYTRNLAASTTEAKYRLASAGYSGPTVEYDGHNLVLSETETELKEAADRHYLRTRVGMEYARKGCAFSPFATYELAHDLQEDFDLVRQRIVIGTDWKLSKHHTLSMAYLLQLGTTDSGTDTRLHILNLGYTFDF